MRLSARIALGTSLVAVAAVGATVSASRAAAASGVVGHVYVNDNTAGENTVAGFDRHADGTLSRSPGSPFAAGGAGHGHGIGSQGALQLSADGRYLLAADAGSNQISVLRIKPDGSLTRRREARRLRRQRAGEHRGPRRPRVRRERRRRRQQLHRLQAESRRAPAAARRLDVRAAGRLVARRRAVQR